MLFLEIVQSDSADAIKIVNEIKKKNFFQIFKQKSWDINISIADDDSERIVDRLNVVTSNILLGIILITILVYF